MTEESDFEFYESTGSGLAGRVFKAWQKSLCRDVAIKIIKPEFSTADALAHAQPLAKAQHETIVKIYGVQEIFIPDIGKKICRDRHGMAGWAKFREMP